MKDESHLGRLALGLGLGRGDCPAGTHTHKKKMLGVGQHGIFVLTSTC